MTQIILENMLFYAYHGFFDEEQKIGNEYHVSVTLDVDSSLAGKTDDLSHTLNYQLVYNAVKAQMSVQSRLVEHAAQRILDDLLATFPMIQKATVAVSKMNPPLGGQVEKVTVVVSGQNN